MWTFKTKEKNEPPTKCICHKGFSGYSSVVARSNFRVSGQETTPQSLTAHTLDRCVQARQRCVIGKRKEQSVSDIVACVETEKITNYA